jgi:mannose-6-phosphate isomerase
MELNEKLYKLKGQVLYYAWGGNAFLPGLLGIDNTENRPFAEYWMGAHPSAPSVLLTPNGPIGLDEAIRQDMNGILSPEVASRFGELPFLFKLQDVKDILSIQVHPSKAAAEKGFDEEEAAGIPITAANRNYKDRNHKPEVAVALSEFWLLHGFRQAAEIEKTLSSIHEFNVLVPYYRREGLKALYQFLMEMDQADVNAMLLPLVKREIRKKKDNELSKDMPGWWVAKLYGTGESIGNIDRAVFSIYFFNIVKLNPGESIFQRAGIPHAYLEGHNVELMANSDNVLRGGLTPKHIDVPELMKHTLFESVVPNVMKGHQVLEGETEYPCPVPDFGIARIELTNQISYTRKARSLEILVVTAGGALVNNALVLKTGEAMAVFAGGEYNIETSGDCTLFRAFVPVNS